MDLDAPISKINVHVRGDFILPMKIPGANLIIGRDNPFTLLVAQSEWGTASGNLFWDDGDSIETTLYNYFEFSLTNAILTINALVRNYKDSPMRLEIVKILGVNNPVTSVNVNGKIYTNFLYNILDEVCSKSSIFKIYFCILNRFYSSMDLIWICYRNQIKPFNGQSQINSHFVNPVSFKTLFF